MCYCYIIINRKWQREQETISGMLNELCLSGEEPVMMTTGISGELLLLSWLVHSVMFCWLLFVCFHASSGHTNTLILYCCSHWKLNDGVISSHSNFPKEPASNLFLSAAAAIILMPQIDSQDVVRSVDWCICLLVICSCAFSNKKRTIGVALSSQSSNWMISKPSFLSLWSTSFISTTTSNGTYSKVTPHPMQWTRQIDCHLSLSFLDWTLQLKVTLSLHTRTFLTMILIVILLFLKLQPSSSSFSSSFTIC